MSTKKVVKNKIHRGILDNVSGTLNNLILTKKGVLMLTKNKPKRRKR